MRARALRVLELGGAGAGYCGRLFLTAGAEVNGVVYRLEPAHIQALVAERAIEALDEAVVRRPAMSEVVDVRRIDGERLDPRAFQGFL